MPNDVEIVTAVIRGDREAYAVLVRRYERSVQAVTLHLLQDHHAAEDATQESFVDAYTDLGSLRDPSKFGPWLLTIARRHALGIARQRHHSVPLDAAGEGGKSSGNRRADPALLGLLAAVNRLPEHEKVVVGLRYFDSRSVAEIAEATGRPVGTVTKQLSRAHQRLRRFLKEPE